MWYFHIIIITYVLELELGRILNAISRTILSSQIFIYLFFLIVHLQTM